MSLKIPTTSKLQPPSIDREVSPLHGGATLVQCLYLTCHVETFNFLFQVSFDSFRNFNSFLSNFESMEKELQVSKWSVVWF